MVLVEFDGHEKKYAPQLQRRFYALCDRVVTLGGAGGGFVMLEAVDCSDTADGALGYPASSNFSPFNSMVDINHLYTL